jgi:hypothetical protein
LNGALNRTVSDSRLSVRPIAGYLDAFELARVVNEDDVPLDLDGTALRLFVKQVVVIENGRCRTESYSYRLQTDVSRGSWLMRWEYVREPSEVNYAYPRAHVHVNGRFPNDAPIGALHIPTRRVPLELVVRHLISDWGVKPRTDDWLTILQESTADFD